MKKETPSNYAIYESYDLLKQSQAEILVISNRQKSPILQNLQHSSLPHGLLSTAAVTTFL